MAPPRQKKLYSEAKKAASKARKAEREAKQADKNPYGLGTLRWRKWYETKAKQAEYGCVGLQPGYMQQSPEESDKIRQNLSEDLRRMGRRKAPTKKEPIQEVVVVDPEPSPEKAMGEVVVVDPVAPSAPMVDRHRSRVLQPASPPPMFSLHSEDFVSWAPGAPMVDRYRSRVLQPASPPPQLQYEEPSAPGAPMRALPVQHFYGPPVQLFGPPVHFGPPVQPPLQGLDLLCAAAAAQKKLDN